MNNFLSNGFTRGEVDRSVTPIPYGEQRVKIVKVWATDSHHKDSTKSNMKTAEELPEWKDATPQLAVTLQGIDPETGKSIGVVTTRFNAQGYLRWSELEEHGHNPDDYFAAGKDGYAVHEDSEMRVPSDFRTKQATNIMNEFLDACGIEEGTEFNNEDDWKANLINRELMVTVWRDTYEGKDTPKVKSPKALEVPAEEVTSTEDA